jgi:hypothetical protein
MYMKKNLLIVRAVSLSAFMITILTEANAQAPTAGGNAASKEQQQQFRQKVMQRFDTNHDGVLNDSEKAHMRETVINENKQHNTGGFLGQPAAGQQGSNSMPKNPHRQMMERFDVNHNGHLDPPEMMQMRQYIQSQGGRGPFGGRPGQRN